MMKCIDKECDDVDGCDCTTTDAVSSTMKVSRKTRKIKPPSSLAFVVRNACEKKRAIQHELCSFDMLLGLPSASVSALQSTSTLTTTASEDMLHKRNLEFATTTVETTTEMGEVPYGKSETKETNNYCHLRSYSWLK